MHEATPASDVREALTELRCISEIDQVGQKRYPERSSFTCRVDDLTWGVRLQRHTRSRQQPAQSQTTIVIKRRGTSRQIIILECPPVHSDPGLEAH